MKKQKIFGISQQVNQADKVLKFLMILIQNPPKTPRQLERLKYKFSAAEKVTTLQNRDLVVVAKNNDIKLPEALATLLQKRSVRTISGVSPIGVLTKAYPCPGRCVYCPTEDRMPKSYMSNQPAAARALRNKFHPYKQVKNRVIALQESGHPVSKLEIIVMGGTWSFLPHNYQNWYIRKMFQAANELEKNNTKKPLFLDFDGVLSDSYDFVLKKNQEALIEQNIHLTTEDFRTIFKQDDTWEAFLNFGGNAKAAEKYTELEMQFYAEKVKLFPKITQFLQKAAEKFDIYIISANQDAVLTQMIENNKLTPFITQLSGRNTPGSKSEKILKILGQKQMAASDCYFVGDSFSDITHGNKAGTKTIGVGWGKIFSTAELKEHGADFSAENITELSDLLGLTDKPAKITKNSLHNLQKANETAEHRIIGLTLETRPDFISEDELVRMRNYGCTRIEIGVQTLDDDISKKTKRGHLKKHVIQAMKLMKDFGFKVCFHLMPGLPGSNIEKDLAWMREIFEDQNFCPDFVKIYPCVVIESAELHKWWKAGEYTAYTDGDLIKLLTQFQTFVPEWTRIMRLMRDIPVSNIVDGAKFSNLRQIIKEQPAKLKEIVGKEFFDKHNLQNDAYLFRDIRSREIGFQTFKNVESVPKPVLKRRDYQASDGQEVFLSFESEDEAHLFALLRLRKPSGQTFAKFKKALKNAALIREVHSYGGEISVGEESGIGQHRGLGKALIEAAEKIAKEEWGLEKMTIIAGVGTREYYRKWGYKLVDTYMVKKLV